MGEDPNQCNGDCVVGGTRRKRSWCRPILVLAEIEASGRLLGVWWQVGRAELRTAALNQTTTQVAALT